MGVNLFEFVSWKTLNIKDKFQKRYYEITHFDK